MSGQATSKADFYVDNLDCESEANAIRRGLAGTPGLVDVCVYPKSAKVSIAYAPASTAPDELAERLRSLGYPPRKDSGKGSLPKPWKNRKVLSAAASGLLLAIGWAGTFAGMPALVSVAFYVAAIVVGGWYFGREAAEELIFEREIGIELLMSVAAIVAALMGEPLEGAILVFLYSISEAAEGYTEEKTRSAIRLLMALAPKTALVRRDGREIEVPVEELRIGDIFIVRPGQSMATDGEILSGASSVNEAPVTGESVPAEKGQGDKVFAGTINGEASLEVRATRTHADNTLARIIQMVEEAQERRGKSQRFIDRFGATYSPAVLGLGILAAVGLPFLLDLSWQQAVLRATVFIVAAAPCALVISIPITMVAALGTAARNGVLIKGGMHVEELAKVSVVALDKTGTLTSGEPQVTDIVVVGHGEGTPADENALLAISAAVERHSEHPLARAIVRRAEESALAIPAVTEFRSMTGAGAEARVNGRRFYIGKPGLFEQQLKFPVEALKDDIARLQQEGKTVVLIGDEGTVRGILALRDNVRPNARAAVAALHSRGIRSVVMLTGDNPLTAQAIAEDAGIDEIFAELKPEDKVAKIRTLAKEWGHVAMVGDGINDAPALAEATVGVAMGAAGTDVALETADVALMADDLEKLVYALRLAQRTQRVVRQNLVLSVMVIGVLVVGAVLGTFTLPVAVVAHEVSEFIVIASGLRMLRS